MSPRSGLDRATILQTAAQFADAEGLEAVTLGRLAAHFEIRTPSLYNHIAGLPGLQRELTLLSLHNLSERLKQATIGRAGDEALIALATAYRAFAREHPGLYPLTLRAPEPGDTAHQEAARELVEILLRILTAYDLRGDEALHAIRVLRSALHGFVSLELAGGFGLPLELDESFQRLLQVMLAGLRAQ